MNTERPKSNLTPIIWVLILAALGLGVWELRSKRAQSNQTNDHKKTAMTPPWPVSLPDQLGAAEKNNIDVFRQSSPSVVFVANKTLVSDWFGLNVREQSSGTGSGFVWDKKGHIISNFHVIYQASAVSVTL